VTYQGRMDGDTAERYSVHEHVLLLALPSEVDSLSPFAACSLTKQPDVATRLSNVHLSHTATPYSENSVEGQACPIVARNAKCQFRNRSRVRLWYLCIYSGR
jgi:hypothetical protein